MFWYILAAVFAALVAFIWWRWTSVVRGARQRDEKLLRLLDPVGEKLASGQTPSTEVIKKLANAPAVRPFLYAALKSFERLDLFPAEYCSELAQAESMLAYWMMHPNELQDAPEQTELVETVVRKIEHRDCRYYVFRYRMPAGHWAGSDWLLGLSGPFVDNYPPYTSIGRA